MANVTKRIGLSLGADICWPICFEEILKRLDLAIDWRGDTLRFEVERVTIEPFDLRQPVRYDLVIDRLTHWYHTSREWIKKAIVLNDIYVFNNPWSVQSKEKHTTYCAMMRLGLPIPETWMLPPKAYEQTADLQPTLTRYAQLFDLGEIGRRIGYPLFMKPYDGGGWVGVTKIDDEAALRAAYEESGTKVMHLQAAVMPYDLFVRCIGLGPQTRVVNYDPRAPLHDRYRMDRDFLTPDAQIGARGHHAHDQRLLRLGLQLLRGAAEGRPLVPDRLRECLSRTRRSRRCTTTSRGWSRRTCAGRSSAPRPRGACGARSTGSRSSRSPATRAAVPGEARALRRDRARTPFGGRSSRTSAAKHLAHLDEVAAEFFASPAAQRCGPQEGDRALPGARGRARSPSSSSAGSSTGARARGHAG